MLRIIQGDVFEVEFELCGIEHGVVDKVIFSSKKLGITEEAVLQGGIYRVYISGTATAGFTAGFASYDLTLIFTGGEVLTNPQKIKIDVKQVIPVSVTNVQDKATVSTNLKETVTVSDDYLRLTNKPKINGIEITGDMTAQELSLLSSKADTYNEVSLEAVSKGSFLLVLTEQGETNKLKIDAVTVGKMSTAENLPPDLQVGNYIFLLKERDK